MYAVYAWVSVAQIDDRVPTHIVYLHADRVSAEGFEHRLRYFIPQAMCVFRNVLSGKVFCERKRGLTRAGSGEFWHTGDKLDESSEARLVPHPVWYPALASSAKVPP